MFARAIPSFIGLTLLAACATSQGAAPPTAARPDTGLAALLGKGPDVALALVGPSQLDRREGEARHLQFASAACILDIYYYRAEAGHATIARHAEARRPDGSPIGAGDCFQLLKAAKAS